MIQDQIAVAAECLNLDPEVVTSRAYDVRDGIIRVSSDIRGVGTGMVGPDLSVPFFTSSISLEEALKVWDTGRRTPRESFAALHQQRHLAPPHERRAVTIAPTRPVSILRPQRRRFDTFETMTAHTRDALSAREKLLVQGLRDWLKLWQVH